MERCSVCHHPQRDQADRWLLQKYPVRKISESLGLSTSALTRHKKHVAEKVERAIQRQEDRAADRLLADTEWLWRESQQLVEDSKNAVKTQAITIGKRTIQREYRDLGPLAQAIRVAHENRRLYGDATGVLNTQNVNITGTVMHVALPGVDPVQSVLNTRKADPVIDVEPIPQITDSKDKPES